MSQYESPLALVDVALFTIQGGRLSLLLAVRKNENEPYCGALALPGGAIHTDADEDAGDAARRVVRTKLGFVKLYVGALNLSAKNKSAEEILKDTGAKRVSMFVLTDEITAKELVASLNNALAANHIPMELALIEARLRQLNEMMINTGVLKKGTVVTLSYLPATGTHIRINSEEKLVIKGEDFFRAMLRIWIGNKPVDGRLRDAMLGGEGGLRLF